MSLIQPLLHGMKPAKIGGLLKTAASRSKAAIKGAAKGYYQQQRLPRLEQCDRFASSAVHVAKRVQQRFPKVVKEMTPQRELFLREFSRNRADDALLGFQIAKAVEVPTTGSLKSIAREVVFQVPATVARKFNNVKTGITQRDLRRILLY